MGELVHEWGPGDEEGDNNMMVWAEKHNILVIKL